MENKNTDLKIKKLHKAFGKNKVINGIDFELVEGERVVILGPSGSGKSTFLRCINWMEEPTSGEIYFNGELVTEKNIRRMRRNIGMVFQHFNLINNLTVMENLTLAPLKLKLMDRAAAEKRAKELLRHIELPNKADAYPASLSGGQKQRIAIIRAMMLSPEDVLSVVRELAGRGMTIMIVTHEMSFAKEIATRIVFIDKGRIIEEGEPEEFFSHPKTPRVREFLKKVL